MITKKICILGAFSVGKTSLVQRYVHSIFSDKYLSTIGVSISKKELEVQGQPMTIMLWDMEGKDVYTAVNLSYLRGASGFFCVADGMRAETLSTALELRAQTLAITGDVPHILLINKADLKEQWEITADMLESAEKQGLSLLAVSAKEATGVEEAFHMLSTRLCAE